MRITCNLRPAEEQLLAFFPVMIVKKFKAGRDTILVDCFEFVIPSSRVLHELLSRCMKSSTGVLAENEVAVVAGPGEKPGRKPHYLRFPTMAGKAIEYLQQHGGGVHRNGDKQVWQARLVSHLAACGIIFWTRSRASELLVLAPQQ